MPSEAAAAASGILRDGSQFQWYVIPLLAIAVYVYAVEIERRNWNVVLAGLALWGMDWFNEIWNALVFHFTGYAPVWGAPGDTAFLLLIGLNVEICFMFAIAGIVFVKTLPRSRELRILGVPNRWLLALVWSVFCVIVELWLNSVGALTWDYAWWSAEAPWLIVPFGYLHFFVAAFLVHDMARRRHQLVAVGAIYAVDATALVLFGGILGWI